jgi:hypothetical protein
MDESADASAHNAACCIHSWNRHGIQYNGGIICLNANENLTSYENLVTNSNSLLSIKNYAKYGSLPRGHIASQWLLWQDCCNYVMKEWNCVQVCQCHCYFLLLRQRRESRLYDERLTHHEKILLLPLFNSYWRRTAFSSCCVILSPHNCLTDVNMLTC